MPNLPTLSVTNQALYDRLVASFNSSPAEYREWHRKALTAEVLRRERQALQNQSDLAQQAKETELDALIQTEWPNPAT